MSEHQQLNIFGQISADQHGSAGRTSTSPTGRQAITTPRDGRSRCADHTAKPQLTVRNCISERDTHDANSNVWEEEVLGKKTTFTYDRNRLMTSVINGQTSTYTYDPYGRLRTIQGGGKTWEKYTYDGFDHVTRHEKLGADGTTNTVTTYTYDPLDRTTSKTEKEGTASAKTTTYSYLGLSAEVLDEEVAGKLTKSFQYSPWGERLSQVKVNADNSEESSYYGYNPHTDVEQITKETGDTRATYGYTAYGKNDDKLFTGVDKLDPVDPTAKEEYNPYRFNAKRYDTSTGMYDMGFRDYNPGLNRFLNLDTYNGALSDLSLGLDLWTANRYAFTGGNPINNIEIDGHEPRPGHCQSTCPTSQADIDKANAENRSGHETMLANFAKRDMKKWMAANGYDPNTGVQKKKPYDPFTPFAVTPDYHAGEERGGLSALWGIIWSLTVDDYVECAKSNGDACQSLAEDALLNMVAAGAGKAAKELGKAIEEAAEAVINLTAVNWKWNSVKTFGHTFSDHGKSVAQLADRARKKGKPQGRWIDNEAAAAFLESVWVEGAGSRVVEIPAGLGQMVFEDGETRMATRARLVPSKNGLYRTAFPILD
ncbi:RHS repeat domain-containing protein [Nonomuraea rubra]